MRLSPVVWLGLALAALAASASGQVAENPRGASLESPVRSVLKQEAYPWYDGQRDAVKPMLPDPSSWWSWLGRQIDAFFDRLESFFGPRGGSSSGRGPSLGRVLPTLLFLAAGVLLLVLLWRLWRLYEPGTCRGDGRRSSVGDAARVAGLAQAGSLEGIDPWAEALRQRAAGNGTVAVVWLFLDQLLSLERAGLIRFSSGKTARQYASMIGDPLLAQGLRSTLGVFEQVYYGHQLPDARTLERVWTGAQAFRGRLQAINPGERR